jgi:hypothetical protein
MPALRHASFSGEAAVGHATTTVVTPLVPARTVTLLTATADASRESGSESGKKSVMNAVDCAAAGAATRPIGRISLVITDRERVDFMAAV